MPKITIELELGEGYEQDPDTGEFYPVDRESFDEQIMRRVVETFASSLNYEGRNKMDAAITEKADALIKERLTVEIDRVISGPLQKYDYMGKPKGDAFTIDELIVSAVQEFASAPAGREDPYSSRKQVPGNLAQLVGDVVKAALADELAKDVRDIRAQVAADIKSRLTGAVANAVVAPR